MVATKNSKDLQRSCMETGPAGLRQAPSPAGLRQAPCPCYIVYMSYHSHMLRIPEKHFKKIPDSNLYGVREKTIIKSILNKLINNVYTLQMNQPQQSPSPLYIEYTFVFMNTLLT